MKPLLGAVVVGACGVCFVVAIVLWRGDQILKDRHLIGKHQYVSVNSLGVLTETVLLAGLGEALQTNGLDTNSWSVPVALDFLDHKALQKCMPFSYSVIVSNRVSQQHVYARIESSTRSNMITYTLYYSK